LEPKRKWDEDQREDGMRPKRKWDKDQRENGMRTKEIMG